MSILFSPPQLGHTVTTLLMVSPPPFPTYEGLSLSCIRSENIAHSFDRLESLPYLEWF